MDISRRISIQLDGDTRCRNIYISSRQNCIQPYAVQAAMNSDFMYWCKAPEIDILKTMLSKSFCFGVYDVTGTSDTHAPDTLMNLVTNDHKRN